MGGVYPPHDGEEDCPGRGENMVGKEQMSKVERMFRVFLEGEEDEWALGGAGRKDTHCFYRFETPYECYQSHDRVYV